MKILLIDPIKRNWPVMGNYVCPPLGLATLAAFLEKHGYQPKIIDCNALNLNRSGLFRLLQQEKPQLVGATAFTPFIYDCLKVMTLAKQTNPNTITVLGGPHVTFLADETLERYPQVDFIVRGEGEEILLNLIQHLEEKADYISIPGLSFRQNGKPYNTTKANTVDLDNLPLPAYHLLPMEKYYFPVLGRFATVITSRGCPYRCTFCSEWDFWQGKWRPRDMLQVVDEIELLYRKYNMESIWIGDDCFNLEPTRIETLCSELLKRDVKISWFYQGRADFLIQHKEFLPLMRRAGNRMVQIGIEDSTDEGISAYNKKLIIQQVKEAVELLQQNDIIVQGMMIIGSRKESPGTVIHKVSFMKWLDIDFPIFTILTPFPGSPLYKEAKMKGWLQSHDYACYDMAHAIMPTLHMTRGEVDAWTHWCFKSFYLDPFSMIKGLISHNYWMRRIWRHMLLFILKQIWYSISGLFDRVPWTRRVSQIKEL